MTDNDVEFLPSGVRLTLTKRRAQRVRHRTFGTEPVSRTALVSRSTSPTGRTGKSARSSGASLHVTEQARRRHPILPVDCSSRHRSRRATSCASLRGRPTNSGPASLTGWPQRASAVDGAPDIRRLRKSTKVEKAIAFGGRIADAANDHHEEVFRGHYAQGTTLRVMSGRVITTAQDHWFTKAVEGPTVLTDSTEVLDAPDQAAALGLTRQQAEDIRRGALDMGLTQCSDPHNSPYGRSGELCPVAPLRCLECRNAWVLPSNLPQLLLFADHLDRLRLRLSPQHFAAAVGTKPRQPSSCPGRAHRRGESVGPQAHRGR